MTAGKISGSPMRIIRGLFCILAFLCAFAYSGTAPAGEADLLNPPIWKEPLTGVEFVRVPAGCVKVECLPETEESSNDKVCTNGFWMGKYEVTRGQFRVFAEASGYRTDAERDGFSWVYTGQWEKKPGCDWRNAGFPQDDNHPVVNVSWNDAEAMAKWLSEKSKGSFRLPSEAQWAYACAAGPDRPAAGENEREACRSGNIADRTALQYFPAWQTLACEDGYIFTAPVGAFRPNAFGLYDMLGNVWEWTEDVCRLGSYEKGRMEVFPPTAGPVRVTRGGSWYTGQGYPGCRSRDILQSPMRRSNDIGFRLLRMP